VEGPRYCRPSRRSHPLPFTSRTHSPRPSTLPKYPLIWDRPHVRRNPRRDQSRGPCYHRDRRAQESKIILSLLRNPRLPSYPVRPLKHGNTRPLGTFSPLISHTPRQTTKINHRILLPLLFRIFTLKSPFLLPSNITHPSPVLIPLRLPSPIHARANGPPHRVE